MNKPSDLNEFLADVVQGSHTSVDFPALINSISNGYANMANLGAKSVEDRFRPAIHCLEREFFAAQLDPDTKMKTSLQLAIMSVIALAPSPITDRVSQYADEKIKAAKVDPYKDRPDLDSGPNGQRLRAGS